jgi:acyl-coenzyme A thioesterase PaaI-like protein
MPEPNDLYGSWLRLEGRLGGAWLFSRLLGRKARYTGSIRPSVRELAPGHARVEMPDRPAVRNHLRSIHAVALINLGEVTGGIALLAALPRNRRGIVTNLSMRYVKKARGKLVGSADFPPPPPDFEGPYTTETELFDDEGDLVAVCTAEWTLGPKKS